MALDRDVAPPAAGGNQVTNMPQATIIRRTFPAEVKALSDTQVEVVISTSALAADGDIWLTEGAELDRYRSNPVWLFDHQPQVPVGRGENIRIDGDTLRCTVEFAPPGISPKADEIRGLVKARIINGVSAGALPIETEPLDPTRPRGGKRWLRWELFETSFVTIPSNQEAMVVARATNAADVPEDLKTDAGKVLDYCAEKVGIGEEDSGDNKGREAPDLRRRMLVTTPKLHVRDLYGVAQLAYLLEQLGYVHACNVWEAECEADDSKVPAMIGEAMKAAGDALIAMTAEEVAELLDGRGVDGDGDDDALPAAERTFVAGAPPGRRRLWRRAFAHMRMLTTRADDDGSIRAAERCVRSLLDATDGEAATLPADAEGTAAARSAAFRRRQVAVAELAAAP